MTIHGVEEFIRHSVVDRAAEALAHKGAVASFLMARHRAPPQDCAGHYLQRPTIDSSPTASFASRSAYAQRGGVQPPPISISISMPLSRPRQTDLARRPGFP